MTPYTPDTHRRPQTPCTTSSNQTMAENARTVGGQTVNGSSATRQIYTNNNHVVLYQRHFNDCENTDASTSSDASTDWRKVKCVLIGDAAVGKTSLIVSYTTNGYPQEYVPTAFDNYSVSVRVDNQPIKLQLCDTAGQDDFDTIRTLCYPNTDVFLVCFSVVNPSSFESVRTRWMPEIRRHSSTAPFILVGTECDLRTNIKVVLDLHRHQLQPVNESQARKFADEIGASAYLECSSLTQQNLKETFDAAILIGLQSSNGYCRPTSQMPARKSLRKLKEKFASRTHSVDSVKNPNLVVKSQDLTTQERHSTHSSASHMNVRGRQKKQLSTNSVPTMGMDMNVIMHTDGGSVIDNQYLNTMQAESPDSNSVKSKKGWRRLLCVA